MTMVIVADFPQGKTFVLIVFVKVNSFDLQKEICSIITFFQYSHVKTTMIALEKVTAMWVNVNAYLIMSMHKIAHTMDVSTSNFN